METRLAGFAPYRVLEPAARADLLLRPPVHSFSMLSVNQFDELVEAGYQHAMESGSAWLEDHGWNSCS